MLRQLFNHPTATRRILHSAFFPRCSSILSRNPLLYHQKRLFTLPSGTDIPFEFITAATFGDIERMKILLENEDVDIDKGDYDLRTALHLAAAEGNVEVCQFLLSKGANVNSLDRSGYTPLECALAEEHGDVINYLRENGGIINEERRDYLTKSMLDSASSGNVAKLKQLLVAGANINDSDYDFRTPLHLAASEGQVEAVEFLLKNDADVNALDRFGNSPLADALRGPERGHKAAAQVLHEKGGKSGTEAGLGVSLLASIQRSIEALFNRGNFSYCEFWIPSSDGQELIFQDGFSSFDIAVSSLSQTPSGKILTNGETNPFGNCWQTKEPQLASEITEESLPGRSEIAHSENMRSFLVIPIYCDGEARGVIAFFTQNLEESLKVEEFADFTDFTSRLLSAGVYGNAQKPMFPLVKGVPEGQQAEVFRLILDKGVFNANIIYAAIDWFYGMDLPSYYYSTFPVEMLANHIHAFIAGRRLASVTGDREKIWVHIENDPNFFGLGAQPEQALLMIPIEMKAIRGAEKRLESRMAKAPSGKGVTVQFMQSGGTIVQGGSKQLGIYVLSCNDYANPSKEINETSSSLWDVATSEFLNKTPTLARERYQLIMDQAIDQLSPVTHIFDEPSADGSVHAVIAFRGGNQMLQLTELMGQNDIVPRKKFLSKFANGIQMYSIYIAPGNDKGLSNVLRQFSILQQLPNSKSLTPRFLRGEIKADDLSYFSAASRFIYYFLEDRTPEFDALEESLKDDTLNLGRLRMMYTSLKREAASRARITEVAIRYPKIISQLNLDLRARITRNWSKDGPVPENEELFAQIQNQSEDQLDKELLMALYNFNKCVLKTNLLKKKKSALSFRLDPSGLNSNWPAVPYAIFFVVGSEFQGLHIRFEDVSRGGIRLIQSHNQAHYNKNVATQFAENYGLAFTQNFKNKDIPEFGSKGTILLNPDKLSQENGYLNFKKYISGIMDLLIPDEEIQDNLGTEEILFLGPDEGTANMMEYAAKYAEKRGYSYWRALTTGKPLSMGGIPHDIAGMTTRSVHRYVVGTLAKLGLEESEITKIQTGGPDGDLGSNEILISKDKTKAVIDGSGVLYDPAGLDREELTRLATKRVMIREFDDSKLGPEGFKILVEDTNVTLPDGSFVDNGMSFRNNFHLHPLCTADLFVPCGGRPETVNLMNIKTFMGDGEDHRFKIIVEGANLFFTNDTRLILEQSGVILFKDASTNKGGVTSSSHEVFSALTLNESNFKKHMLVEDESNIPEFYNAYCQDIIRRVEENADLEFECLWSEHERTGTPRYILSEELSNKINELNKQVKASNLWDQEAVRDAILMKAIPKTLTDLMPLEKIHKNCPESYLQAMFACYIASRYVYKYGVDASDFAFYDFMQNI